MKLVLSRKGFDSESGGSFSPYDHVTGRYIWLPIPEKEKDYSNRIRYSDILVKHEYINGLKGTNLSEVYKSLKRKDQIKLRKNEYASIDDKKIFAHFDPMLGMPPWMQESERCIIGKGFGQSNASRHLEKQSVKEGSIFLFFGGFQSVVDAKISGHFIYGWLKVKKRIETYEECKEILDTNNLHYHPHITKAAFEVALEKGQKNFIFIPDEWLFEDLNIPGYGYFMTLNDDLLLSESKVSNISIWKLPEFFYKNLTYVLSNTWKKTRDGFCTVETRRGQEFVHELSEKGKDWLRELFLRNQDNIFTLADTRKDKRINMRTKLSSTLVPKKPTKVKSFQDYLLNKHILKSGESKIKSISAKQYVNRLESMRRKGIYNEENTIDPLLEQKIQAQYKDWKTYVKTIEYYIDFKGYLSQCFD